MSAQFQNQIRATTSPVAVTPVSSGLFQRKCACAAKPSSIMGECDECSKNRTQIQRKAWTSSGEFGVPFSVPNVPDSGPRTFDGEGGPAGKTRLAHDFGKIRVQSPSKQPVDGPTISHAGDQLEQEADRVADQTMRIPEPMQRLRHAPSYSNQRKAHESSSPLASSVGSSGRPLDVSTRSFMEGRFGHDFGGVRVHDDERAAESARALNARAYTVGHDVVFGAGQYSPSTSDGRLLLAHELTHVLQQRTAPGSILQRKLLIDESAGTKAPSLKAAVESLAGGKLVPSDVGVKLAQSAGTTGGSITIKRFIERAIDSKQNYRLRWGVPTLTAQPSASAQPSTAAAPQPAQQSTPQPAPQTPPAPPQASALPGSVERLAGEIVMTVNPALIGEVTYSPEELVADQLVAAVTQFDPSTQMAPSTTRSSNREVLPDVNQDELLSTTEAAENQSHKKDRIKAFADKELTHLTSGQRRLIALAGAYTKGVPMTEVIRGVETNTPFRMRQDVVGGRVNVTYVDPRLLPANADTMDESKFVSEVFFGSMSRRVTFIPGADPATAAPLELPLTGSTCTADQRRDNNNSCCTPDMLAEFGQHMNTARDAIDRTIQRLQGTDLIDCKIRPHFKDHQSEADLEQIILRLRAARSELSVSRHSWKCRPERSGLLGCTRNVSEAKEGVVGGVTIERNITICVGSGAPFTESTTVLHEVMHRVGIHGTEHYQGMSGYPGDDPLSNADSYAQLVHDLGASTITPCRPVPFDTSLVGGGGSRSGFVLGARLEATPLGPGLRIVDWTVGLNFLWAPQQGVVPGGGNRSEDILKRGYLGFETGGRLSLPRSHGQLQFDATIGIGLAGPIDDPEALVAGRVSGKWRFGKELSGPEVGLDLTRLQSLAERANGEWVIGVSAGYHFGRSEKRKPRK